MRRSSRLRLTLPLAGLFAGAAAAHAAPLESVPPACRAQVERAASAVSAAFAGSKRAIAAGAPGSIEAAIFGYAPPRLHPVDEGAVPRPRTGGSCPKEMVRVLDRFCVDKWEGSLVRRLPDGKTEPHSPYVTPEDGHVYVAQSAPDVVPQAYLSAKQAEAACREAGKRLCQPAEWRVACGGSQGYAFPYGPKREKGTCHDSGKAPMMTFYASTMKKGWGKKELNDPRNNQLKGTLAKTGAYPGCVNDFGAFDMVGNLHEWTADTNGTFQGGYWLDTSQHGDGCAYRTIAHGYTYHDYSTGFRCCADLK
jgi:formylglycine-generating enzyme